MKPMECKDLERVLRAEDPELLNEFESHTAVCPRCAEEIRLWNEISLAAPGLRKKWDSPQLWPKIQVALEAEKEKRTHWLQALWGAPMRWAPAAALAILLISVGVSAWIVLRRPVQSPSPNVQRRLLTEDAVREVEKSEASYEASIEKLSKLAGPKVDSPQTPLEAAYREKLAALDAAIDECRAQVNRNPANPHLRRELLAMYREKQDTLEQVLREE